MVKDREAQSEVTTRRRVDAVGIVAAVLCWAGVVVASTVWWADRVNADLPCMTGGGCEQVASSSYAHLHPFGLDIPVALLGAAGYLLLYCLSMARFAVAVDTGRRNLALAATVVSGGGVVYSWWLQYVAHFKIGAFCPWCFTSACLMTAICVVSVFAARQSKVSISDVDDSPAALRGKRERKAAAGRRQKMAVAIVAPLLVVPPIAAKLAQRPPAPPPAAPTFNTTASSSTSPPASTTAPASTPADSPSMPTSVNIDIPTWITILEHTDSQCRGPMRTPYTLVEFGDFQCPTCAKARPQIEGVLDSAKVNMFFINYPLAIHKWAVPAAEAAFAAAAQGKFWAMYDALYRHQDNLEPSRLAEYADSAGVDGSQVAAALASHKYMPNVQKSEDFCRQIKVSATPTLLIRNNMSGAATVAVGLDQIQSAILTTDWHAYDNVDLSHLGQASPKKKRTHD